MPDDVAIVQRVIRILGARARPDEEGLEERIEDALVDIGVDIDDEAACERYIAQIKLALHPKRDAPDDALCSAPYRFVALNEGIAPASEAVRAHGLDLPLPGGFCGSIDVEWAAETPILIGKKEGGRDEDGPMRLGTEGPYVIPGSTIRGMLRATCEIIAYGRLFQVNRHHRYGVRDFTHTLFTGDERPSWDKLHAGWLRRAKASDKPAAEDDSDYVIEPCRKYMIRIRDLPSALNGGGATSNGAFHKQWLLKPLEARYRAVGQVVDATRPARFDFSPRASGCKFSHHPDRPEHLVPDPSGGIAGIFVCAGPSNTVRNVDPTTLDQQDADPAPGPGHHKKREYVFVEDPAAEILRVKRSAFKRFELAHGKPSKNKWEPDGSYAVLHPTLEHGDRIPVFYIGDPAAQEDWTFSIGLTRLFKRAHRYSVGEVLAREQGHLPGRNSAFRPDMAEALFGHVYEPDELGKDPDGSTAPAEVALKGRAAFGFAIAEGGSPAQETLRPVMMGPRASYAPFYLRGTYKDWTDDNAHLAGRKRYFPRYPLGPDASVEARGQAKAGIYGILGSWRGNQNEQTRTTLHFLESASPGGEILFRGEIRLHNVAAEEIGMLLWALTHGGDPAKPYRHMIGRAKAAGAGQVRVKRLRLRLAGNDSTADALRVQPAPWELPRDGTEGWTVPDGWSLAPFLRAFEQAMRLVDRRWPASPPVLEQLSVAKPALWSGPPEANRTAYLELGKFKRVRDLVKCDGQELRRPSGPDRLLAIPTIPPDELNFPYRR